MSLLQKIAGKISPGTIDEFKATIGKRGGLAKANRFAIFMSPPDQSVLNLDVQSIIGSVASESFNVRSLINDPRDIGLLCESCSIPGRQIQTSEYSPHRHLIKTPNGYINEDVTMVFHLTNDYYMKRMFDRWQNIIIDTETYKLAYGKEYKRDITIQQLNDVNIPIYGVRLKNAFPVAVQNIDMSNASENGIQKLSVTFTYEDFIDEGITLTSISGVSDALSGITNSGIKRGVQSAEDIFSRINNIF